MRKSTFLLVCALFIVYSTCISYAEQPVKKFTNKLGMEFVLIPAGTFMIGSPKDEPGRYANEIQHRVNLTKAFYMQTTEVTQGQWKAIMGKNPAAHKGCGDNCPVEQVSWNDVQTFIQKLNQKEGTDRYRLPTEAEWEYACRAGSTTKFCFGDDETKLSAHAWYYDNSGPRPHPVGQKKPNAWGLYDVHGNVREWCQDRYGFYPSSPVADSTGPSSGTFRRVFRGGSWNDYAERCRSAFRGWGDPGGRGYDLGFRVARDL